MSITDIERNEYQRENTRKALEYLANAPKLSSEEAIEQIKRNRIDW
ncbi:hypothetical protein [Ekhidna sp.]